MNNGPIKAIPVSPKRTAIDEAAAAIDKAITMPLDQPFVAHYVPEPPDPGVAFVEQQLAAEPVPEEWTTRPRRRRLRRKKTEPGRFKDIQTYKRKHIPKQDRLPPEEIVELNIKREFARKKQPLELGTQLNLILQAARELSRLELDHFANITASLQGLTPAGRKRILAALLQVYS